MMEKNARVKTQRSASPKLLPKLEPVYRLDILGEVNKKCIHISRKAGLPPLPPKTLKSKKVLKEEPLDLVDLLANTETAGMFSK